MHWKRIGKIFDPDDHLLPGGCTSFAQSPQTLVFDDFVRVYFSSREKDSRGKFLSHICYVDFSKDFSSIISVSKNIVLPLGNPGCYDEHGIFPLNPLMFDKKIFAWIGGWNRRVSVSVDGAIGLATSDTGGETFNRIGDGPVLCASLNEPFLVGDPFVKFYDGVFHMWYIFGKKWKKYDDSSVPERIYKIGYARSENGLDWERPYEGQPIVSNVLGEDESQALPTVVKIKNKYHMLFCFRESFDFRKNTSRGYRLGHAWSEDLVTWFRDDASPLVLPLGESGQWDSEMICYPHLAEVNGEIYLLYNGNQFGRHGFGAAQLHQD